MVRQALRKVEPFGSTSLRDAIADAAGRVAAGGHARRALVVLTDGVDTSSRLTPPEVSGIASAIDVPVYIFAVVSPLDNPADPIAIDPQAAAPKMLQQLAEWTGGGLHMASSASHISAAAREIVGELRHQYLLAFEPSHKPGWHSLEVRVRDRDLIVRARSGYIAGPQRPVRRSFN
jgi:Ca-activated chloride channel family protein